MDLADLVHLVNLFNLAEIYKHIRRNKETIGAAFGRAPQGRGAPLWLVSLFFLVFLYIWATILVIRMVALAFRMVSRYHPNHPSLSPRPEFVCVCVCG